MDFENYVTLKELFDEKFMTTYTNSSTISDFFHKGNFNIKSAEDFKAIPPDTLNSFISQNSDFDTWSDMLKKASAIHVKKQLGF